MQDMMNIDGSHDQTFDLSLTQKQRLTTCFIYRSVQYFYIFADRAMLFYYLNSSYLTAMEENRQ